jgi:Tn3 transposase DDE domain
LLLLRRRGGQGRERICTVLYNAFDGVKRALARLVAANGGFEGLDIVGVNLSIFPRAAEGHVMLPLIDQLRAALRIHIDENLIDGRALGGMRDGGIAVIDMAQMGELEMFGAVTTPPGAFIEAQLEAVAGDAGDGRKLSVGDFAFPVVNAELNPVALGERPLFLGVSLNAVPLCRIDRYAPEGGAQGQGVARGINGLNGEMASYGYAPVADIEMHHVARRITPRLMNLGFGEVAPRQDVVLHAVFADMAAPDHGGADSGVQRLAFVVRGADDECFLIREAMIEDQWDDVLRFNATIRLKVTTASQLFKRLNSYSRQHPLYQALKEFGKIPKTLFILKYRDDLEYRQAIEKQLNKIEGSNKFSKAISFGHNQEFIQGEKEDQEIAESCRRLIKNAIVCWNYLYLSRELAAEKNEKRRAELVEAIRHGSAATWKHFNLHGEFDFSDERMVDSMGLAGLPKNPAFKEG